MFKDRRSAGIRLAQLLLPFKDCRPVILALPRGGVPVAYEVAQALQVPLQVFVVRKIGAPGHEELGIGALAEGGIKILDEQLINHLAVTPDELKNTINREGRELKRRVKDYRGKNFTLDLQGRTVIIIDDGLATGFSARAALEAVRRKQPAEIILASPVCPRDTAETLSRLTDRVVCLAESSEFASVGSWYEDFSQVTDEEVKKDIVKSRLAEG